MDLTYLGEREISAHTHLRWLPRQNTRSEGTRV